MILYHNFIVYNSALFPYSNFKFKYILYKRRHSKMLLKPLEVSPFPPFILNIFPSFHLSLWSLPSSLFPLFIFLSLFPLFANFLPPFILPGFRLENRDQLIIKILNFPSAQSFKILFLQLSCDFVCCQG